MSNAELPNIYGVLSDYHGGKCKSYTTFGGEFPIEETCKISF